MQVGRQIRRQFFSLATAGDHFPSIDIFGKFFPQLFSARLSKTVDVAETPRGRSRSIIYLFKGCR
jgi:hypothetical protein